MNIKASIMLVIGIVVAVVLVPAMWDSVYTDALTNGGTNCNLTAGTICPNGTTSTLLKLVPMMFVGAVIIAGVVLGARSQ